MKKTVKSINNKKKTKKSSLKKLTNEKITIYSRKYIKNTKPMLFLRSHCPGDVMIRNP